MRALIGLICLIGGFGAAVAAHAAKVGERHLTATSPTASVRDAQHRPTLRITVWYPAAASAQEQSLDIGPPGKPLFHVGNVAADAAFAPAPQGGWPVILLSHGNGGSARGMGWFGIPLARASYVVIAVDHPGNNAIDPMTAASFVAMWERAEDLKLALATVERDPSFGAKLDLHRLGVSGFSAGGFTALVVAGARVDPGHLYRFCLAHPDDGICRPQPEFALSLEAGKKVFESPALAPLVAHAGDDHSIPGVRAVFAMAPALVQALDPASLPDVKVPVRIVLGAVDPVASPASNGLVAARAIPNAKLSMLPKVGHYDFLADCTDAGRTLEPECAAPTVPQESTHRYAIDAALTFFGETLR